MVEVLTFQIPEKGFEFIENEYSKEYVESITILFLDINMPTWSGWAFLENFEHLASEIKKQIRIYMLSSSVDQKDMERALNNGNVCDYIKKPLNKNKLLELFTFK